MAVDPYADRRRMPRIILSPRIHEKHNDIDNCILASGNLEYFVNYGLALANSHQLHSRTTPLIINCIDFSMSLAQALLDKALPSNKNIFFSKTQLNHKKITSTDEKICFYKTIRFEVAKHIQSAINCNIAIIDIDSLYRNDARHIFECLHAEGIDFGIGSTMDFCSKSMHEVGEKNFPWRTIKAGFSYYSKSSLGKLTLIKICNKLFNYLDKIPPVDNLKLYTAYYGDQLALLFTMLELLSAPNYKTSHVKCIGHIEGDLVSFGDINSRSILWIPPASKRVEKEFQPETILQ